MYSPQGSRHEIDHYTLWLRFWYGERTGANAFVSGFRSSRTAGLPESDSASDLVGRFGAAKVAGTERCCTAYGCVVEVVAGFEQARNRIRISKYREYREANTMAEVRHHKPGTRYYRNTAWYTGVHCFSSVGDGGGKKRWRS